MPVEVCKTTHRLVPASQVHNPEIAHQDKKLPPSRFSVEGCAAIASLHKQIFIASGLTVACVPNLWLQWRCIVDVCPPPLSEFIATQRSGSWNNKGPIQLSRGSARDKKLLTLQSLLRTAAEKYTEPTRKQQNKYVAKSLVQKCKDIVHKSIQKAHTNCGISRKPYGNNCGVCIGHKYPVSLIKWSKNGSAYNGSLCEVCNWAFNSRLKGGERRRCGHRQFLANSVQL